MTKVDDERRTDAIDAALTEVIRLKDNIEDLLDEIGYLRQLLRRASKHPSIYAGVWDEIRDMLQT